MAKSPWNGSQHADNVTSVIIGSKHTDNVTSVIIGLFICTEQVVEATHQKFSVFWERFKVLELEREKHGDQLLACVLEFNACNFLNKLKKHIESIHVNVHYPCKQCE